MSFFDVLMDILKAIFGALSGKPGGTGNVDEDDSGGATALRVLLLTFENDTNGSVTESIAKSLGKVPGLSIVRTTEITAPVDDNEVLPSSLAAMVRKARIMAASEEVGGILGGHITANNTLRLRLIPARLDTEAVSCVLFSGDLVEFPLPLNGTDEIVAVAALTAICCDTDGTRRNRSDRLRELPQSIDELVGSMGGLSPAGEASIQLFYAGALITSGFRTDQKALLEKALDLTKDALAKAKEGLTAAQVGAARARFAVLSTELALRSDDFQKTEEFVSHFRMAAETYPLELFPDENAFLNTQMARVLARLGQSTGKIPFMRSAVDAYFEASRSWNKAWRPDSWAELQNNMGSVMTQIGEFSGNSEILGRASRVFESITEVWSRDKKPKQWANIQNNIGACRFAEGKRSNDMAILREALERFSLALEVYAAEGMTKNVTVTQKNIARVERVIGSQEAGASAPKADKPE
ncbi:hypothetical protein HEQ62_05095 [Haematospirillum jordaniae]|uniref:Uncharacterized protein n=1 Tax=Haematospirillum jordaniae TaxID=1549855 RepID=A0A143DCX5_9PROT|nr:hypothetical protein [Haematospirillum jordaniae]AMW34449.1 hypothetical protein AY555_03775 [Haematospirillum jordaniae]NKD44563.1 hypothetical protein [Haematospirillum jordaniae]NKD57583.1 hypothetical protein [Haematospirillum jordaniae]NKD59153.1 hypothetical protein [Haematospirillum jordaniae]NKD67291.1 hypothetical protein [Haematospirillum jordaniae]